MKSRTSRIALIAFVVLVAAVALAATLTRSGLTGAGPSDLVTAEARAAAEARAGRSAEPGSGPRTVEERAAADRLAGKAAVAKGAPLTVEARAARVERGHYLVQTIGCGDCHTPKNMTPEGPVEDDTRLLSGHPQDEVIAQGPGLDPEGPWVAATNGGLTAWRGPWGTSFTANLTPDENTGLGIWTEEMFVRALRTGKHMGQSRPILPPMPWFVYRKLTDEDLASIYAYLRTIEPIHNRVPEPLPPYGSQVADAGI